MADIYETPLGAWQRLSTDGQAPAATSNRRVVPVPLEDPGLPGRVHVPLRALAGLRWVTWVAAGNTPAATWLGTAWLPTTPWRWIAMGWLRVITPPGRMLVSVREPGCC